MAISLPLSKFNNSHEAVVAAGAVIQAEGMALVRTSASQSAGVLPSTGGTAEIFVGFSFAGTSAAPFPEGYTNKVEKFVVPTGGAIALALTPVSGQVSVYDNTAGAIVASPTVSGAAITGLTAGHNVTVTYKYAMTVVQARALYGDVQPGGYSGAYVNQIGLVKSGIIYTSEFDASVDWSAATGIKLMANGQLGNQAGSGLAISSSIIALPGVDYPFLGISFSAAA